MTTYKLVVEVVDAHIPMSSDGQRYPDAYVELDFDSQQFRTTVKEKAVSTIWEESLYFTVSDTSNLDELVLRARVYNTSRSIQDSKSFHGEARISGSTFKPLSDAVLLHYPLEQPGMFSRVRGELGLKVYITDDASDHSSRPHNMPFQYLKDITNGFSEQRILGQGGFGVVYQGVPPNGEMIAVKRITPSLMPGLQKQFENDVYHLIMLKHPNIVRCVGYCYETRNEFLEYNGEYVFAEMAERLLCLEYIPKGSLDKYISDEYSGLDWSTRYEIVKGVCYGLGYLHEEIDKPIIHLDLKPANILLDNSFVPKITDFGLSRLLGQETICTSSCVGTLGYMAPEYLHGGTITPKLDIFSLGVIIVEIITGHRDYPGVTGTTTSDDFIELALKRWRDVLQRSPGYGFLERDCEQIKRCIQVGLTCVNPDRTKRPSIGKIINMLQGSGSIDCDISNEAA